MNQLHFAQNSPSVNLPAPAVGQRIIMEESSASKDLPNSTGLISNQQWLYLVVAFILLFIAFTAVVLLLKKSKAHQRIADDN